MAESCIVETTMRNVSGIQKERKRPIETRSMKSEVLSESAVVAAYTPTPPKVKYLHQLSIKNLMIFDSLKVSMFLLSTYMLIIDI